MHDPPSRTHQSSNLHGKPFLPPKLVTLCVIASVHGMMSPPTAPCAEFCPRLRPSPLHFTPLLTLSSPFLYFSGWVFILLPHHNHEKSFFLPAHSSSDKPFLPQPKSDPVRLCCILNPETRVALSQRLVMRSCWSPLLMRLEMLHLVAALSVIIVRLTTRYQMLNGQAVALKAPLFQHQISSISSQLYLWRGLFHT